MFDAFTKVVAQADARGEFLNAGQIDALAAMVAESNKRMDAVNRITSNASKIVTGAARDLFDQQPALIAPGGNAYTHRRMAACLRDMEIILRYVTYAVFTGDASVLEAPTSIALPLLLPEATLLLIDPPSGLPESRLIGILRQAFPLQSDAPRPEQQGIQLPGPGRRGKHLPQQGQQRVAWLQAPAKLGDRSSPMPSLFVLQQHRTARQIQTTSLQLGP